MKPSDLLRRNPIVAGLAAFFVVALTVVGGLLGANRTEANYQSSGILLIIPPGAGSDIATNNPFVNLDQNISQLAQALGTQMSSPSVVSALKDRAPSVTGYTATVRYDNAVVNSMPTSQLQFTVTGTDPQVVRDAVQQLMVMAGTQLKTMQEHAGVSESTLADTVQLVAATEPEAMPVSGARAAGLWGISGLLLSLVILAVVGGLWRIVGGKDDATAEVTEASAGAASTASAEPADAEPADAEPADDKSAEPAAK